MTLEEVKKCLSTGSMTTSQKKNKKNKYTNTHKIHMDTKCTWVQGLAKKNYYTKEKKNNKKNMIKNNL